MEATLISLNIAGLVLSLFFIAIILSKQEKQLKDYLLSFFIFLLGTFLLIKYVFQYDLYNTYPIIIYLDIAYWVLLGPTLYIYTLVSTKGENHLRLSYMYTLIPAVLVIICFSEYIFGNPTGLFNTPSLDQSVLVEIGFYIWLYNSPIFYVLTIIAIRKHQRKIKTHYSFSKSIDLKWLYYLSTGFAVFIIFLLAKGWVQYFLDWRFPFDNYSLSMGVLFIYIFGIGYYGYKQSGIFNVDIEDETYNPKLAHSIVLDKGKNHLSYQKSGLNEEDAQVIISKLQNLMISDQLFLESELHLTTLSDKTDVSTHKISQAINEYLNKNFFDFVNDYRIKKVKELLSNPENNQFKIVSLAYDSGFSSKSTFYTLFKKSEGITPAQYRSNTQKKAG